MTEVKESAGGVILNPQGQIVLVCQHQNSWSFPKGGVEEGETLLEAAKREIEEEVGITDLTYIRPLGSYERYSIGKDGMGENKEWGNKRRTFFLFTTPTQKLQPQDGEITDARWVTISEALGLLTHPKDREFLVNIQDRILPS